MYSANETTRRDWLILILGLLAGGWFFFDYGNHHPLWYADASLGKQAVETRGFDQLNQLGYLPADPEYLATFKTRNTLLDEMQARLSLKEIFTEVPRPEVFRLFYWDLALFFPDDVGGLDIFEFQQRDFNASVSIRTTFSQDGEWLELLNPKQRRPGRLLNESALRRAFPDLPTPLLTEARDDSVVLSTFSFDFSRPMPVGQDGIILAGAEHLQRLASYYLEQTGWPLEQLEFNAVRVVSFDTFEAGEVTYVYADPEAGQELQLKLLLSPAGALLSMEAEYIALDPSEVEQFILITLRGLFIFIFSVWLIILLYIRVTHRIVDTTPAILIAVLAGFIIPASFILPWIYEQGILPGLPGVMDIIIVLLSSGFTAALISLFFFVVVVIGESVTRRNWITKIRTMDLIRTGHFFSLPVGTVCIHAVSFALMLAAAWSALMWLVPGAYVSTGERFISDTTYLAPLLRLLMVFFITLFTIHVVFLILAGLVRGWVKNNAVIVSSIAVVFVIMVPIYIDSGDVTAELALHGIIGVLLGLIYVYRDFLTTFLSFFLFTLLLTSADGWLMIHSPDILVFYLSGGIGVLLFLFGFLAITRGKPVNELPKYVPAYIEDLAQEERIKQELQIARKVQQSFLPVRQPDLEGLDLAAVCIPAYETGGDYYDFIDMGDNRVAVIVGDVSGKGFQAAFYMTFIKGVLHALCQEYGSTVTILQKANKLFLQNSRRGTFITLIFGIIDLKEHTFIFSRAGHNPLFHYKTKENLLDVVQPKGLAIGMTGGERFVSNMSESLLHLEKGDMLLLYTDGIVEAANEQNSFYGEGRLKRMAYFHQAKPAKEILDHILRDIKKFTGEAKQHDDMTLLVIKKV